MFIPSKCRRGSQGREKQAFDYDKAACVAPGAVLPSPSFWAKKLRHGRQNRSVRQAGMRLLPGEPTEVRIGE
jgi:hypothetical protein